MAQNQIKDELKGLDKVTAIAQNAEADNVNRIALRRAKVRELMRMGCESHQILLILQKGIKVSDGKTVKIRVTESIIKNDIEYVRQENTAVDTDFREKRAGILDKLSYLYNRAITEYANAKGQTRNSFLNTALAVLTKISDIEGIKIGEGGSAELSQEAEISKFAEDVNKLEKDEQTTILAAIHKVREQRKLKTTGDARVPSKKPGVPAQTGDNEGVS